MTSHIFNRRRLLISGAALLGTGTAAVAGSVVACNMADSRSALLPTMPRLFVAIPEIREADVVGLEMAGQLGREMTVEALASRPAMREACAIRCDSSRLSRIRKAVRNDFHDGRCIVIGRWVLSESEALIAGAWSVGVS